MFFIRKIQLFAMVAAVLGCLASAGQLLAGNGGPPNVNYAANGTFASPPISGNDGFLLAGQTFSLNIVVNETAKPTKHTKSSAQYTNLALSGTVYTGLLPGQPQMIPPGTVASLYLVVAGAGKQDVLTFSFPINLLGLPITFSAKVYMPSGTITTPAIRPFKNPVSLTPSNGSMTYTCGPGCPPQYTSTTLGFASGTIVTTLQ